MVNILDADASVTHRLSDADLNVICEKTDGYSGSDMKHLVQEAARAPLRELFQSVAAGGGGAGRRYRRRDAVGDAADSARRL